MGEVWLGAKWNCLSSSACIKQLGFNIFFRFHETKRILKRTLVQIIADVGKQQQQQQQILKPSF